METEKNENILTDNQLDMLLADSAARKQRLEQINREVMHTVRRDIRRKTAVKWAKLLGVCFAIPAAVVTYVFALNHVVQMLQLQNSLKVVCLTIPLVTIGIFIAKNIKNFHPEL